MIGLTAEGYAALLFQRYPDATRVRASVVEGSGVGRLTQDVAEKLSRKSWSQTVHHVLEPHTTREIPVAADKIWWCVRVTCAAIRMTRK